MSANSFNAYIISHLPLTPAWRDKRLKNAIRQIHWWHDYTSVTIHLRTCNWQSADYDHLPHRPARIVVEEIGANRLIVNRQQCLRSFYDSDADWGIMLDDDAILYDTHHNSSYNLFNEMTENGVDAYKGVDVFFPINPAKQPFTNKWRENRTLYESHHVFKRSMDLKGSFFAVRNFVKHGELPVLLDPSFSLVGEDTYFALQAVRQGYSVMQCLNIVLNELDAESHFGTISERTEKMAIGNRELVRRFLSDDLRMQESGHLLHRKAFLMKCWGARPTEVYVPKPISKY